MLESRLFKYLKRFSRREFRIKCMNCRFENQKFILFRRTTIGNRNPVITVKEYAHIRTIEHVTESPQKKSINKLTSYILPPPPTQSDFFLTIII